MNKIILKGRITKELELKELDNDRKVVNFNIAVRRDYKNENKEYESDFFNCSAFGNTANFLVNYFKKGQDLLLIGHLQNNQWETESGEKRTAINVIVESVEFCGNKQENNKTENFEDFAQQNDIPINTETGDDLPF